MPSQDFRPSEIVSDVFREYRARIPGIMEMARPALVAYTLKLASGAL